MVHWIRAQFYSIKASFGKVVSWMIHLMIPGIDFVIWQRIRVDMFLDWDFRGGSFDERLMDT